LAGDIIAYDAAILASFAALRAELDEIDAALDAAGALAAGLPHRERYLRLVHRFGRLSVESRCAEPASQATSDRRVGGRARHA